MPNGILKKEGFFFPGGTSRVDGGGGVLTESGAMCVEGTLLYAEIIEDTKQAGIKTVTKQSVPAFSAPVYHNHFSCVLPDLTLPVSPCPASFPAPGG